MIRSWERESKPPPLILEDAERWINKFKSLHCSKLPLEKHPQQTFKWSPPPVGKFKMNVDVAIPRSSDCFGVGIIIRDHPGGVIVAMAKRFPVSPTAFLAECAVFREA
ncbi:non-LTR retroelement reverse transcriptase [Parasponia andersonii]|uniref:Non-LTR retroelement reverse transcriptase n=1 Tax=Parasponia andersonii TaxID=3476 RepID=A0A2P5BIW7_PARAD|nr:non-LTR retroelement reverse transcriptase [Parasponia andersonii]